MLITDFHIDTDIAKDIEYMQRLSYFTNVVPVIAKSDTLSAQEVVALKTSILARLQTTAVRPFFFGKAMDDALLAVQGLPVARTSSSGEPSEAAEYPQFPGGSWSWEKNSRPLCAASRGVFAGFRVGCSYEFDQLKGPVWIYKRRLEQAPTHRIEA